MVTGNPHPCFFSRCHAELLFPRFFLVSVTNGAAILRAETAMHSPHRYHGGMKQLVAIVKPFRAQAVLEAIGGFQTSLVRVSEAKGFGRQKDLLRRYLGSEYNPVYLPKIEIVVLLADELVQPVIETIVSVARTGRIGDGKILVFPALGEVDF